VGSSARNVGSSGPTVRKVGTKKGECEIFVKRGKSVGETVGSFMIQNESCRLRECVNIQEKMR
jgi:hypothetical protein